MDGCGEVGRQDLSRELPCRGAEELPARDGDAGAGAGEEEERGEFGWVCGMRTVTDMVYRRSYSLYGRRSRRSLEGNRGDGVGKAREIGAGRAREIEAGIGAMGGGKAARRKRGSRGGMYYYA